MAVMKTISERYLRISKNHRITTNSHLTRAETFSRFWWVSQVKRFSLFAKNINYLGRIICPRRLQTTESNESDWNNSENLQRRQNAITFRSLQCFRWIEPRAFQDFAPLNKTSAKSNQIPSSKSQQTMNVVEKLRRTVAYRDGGRAPAQATRPWIRTLETPKSDACYSNNMKIDYTDELIIGIERLETQREETDKDQPKVPCHGIGHVVAKA